MKLSPGTVSLVRFPQTNLESGKYRPVVVLAALPGPFGDLLICAVTSQLQHKVEEWDEVVDRNDPDFASSGLKTTSLIRIGKLATVDPSVLEGALGKISEKRLKTILQRISEHLAG